MFIGGVGTLEFSVTGKMIGYHATGKSVGFGTGGLEGVKVTATWSSTNFPWSVGVLEVYGTIMVGLLKLNEVATERDVKRDTKIPSFFFYFSQNL